MKESDDLGNATRREKEKYHIFDINISFLKQRWVAKI